MLPVKEAESVILGLVQPFDEQLDVEIVDLPAATGRILASSVTSQLDFPHWDNSAMDGYAVRFADVQFCDANQPTILEIVEEIPAGYQPQCPIASGQAARIFTGAVMPTGADTVVIQERTRREENRVLILEPPEPQAFVRHRASFYQAGMPLLKPGITLGAPEIAVLAAAQCTQLSVYRRPRVAILSTGDELVTPDQTLQPGQIVDSNLYALAAFVTLCGGVPVPLGIVRDQPEALKKAISGALEIAIPTENPTFRGTRSPNTSAISSADIILSTGGVSVGDHDYVDQILGQLGAEIHIRSVGIKPGKPLTVATVPRPLKQDGTSGLPRPVLYFGIPGNPVSALVTCWRFVQSALKKLSGLPQEVWKPVFVKAITCHDLRADGRRETYLWGKLRLDAAGTYEFHLTGGSHSSGNLINLVQTTGLAVVPVGQTFISAGEPVQVLQVGFSGNL